MTLQQAMAFALMGGAVLLFIWGKLRYDLVAVLALVTGVLIGVIPEKEMFSGFSNDLRIPREELDRHFGVPVVASVDQMTAALQQALHARLRPLMEPAMRNLPVEAVDAAPTATLEHQNVTSIFARPEGPGPWKLRGRATK